MIRFRFIAALLVVIVAWVMCGCTKENTKPHAPAVRYAYQLAPNVYEVRLEDGTRCVTAEKGGITCDWHKGVE